MAFDFLLGTGTNTRFIVIKKMVIMWGNLIRFGIDTEGSTSFQKRVILTNQLSFIAILLLSVVVLMVTIADIAPLVPAQVIMIFVLLSVPYINYKGYCNTGAVLLSVSVPVIIFMMGLTNKIYMENIYIGAYLLPRLGIISAGVIPMLLIDHKQKKMMLGAIAVGLVCLLALEPVNELMGVEYKGTEGEVFNYKMFTWISFVPYAFIIWSTYFLQTITRRYEVLAENSARDLRSKNYILCEQKEEIEQQNINLQFAKEAIEIRSRKITDSIVCARRIQNAIFPKAELFETNFPGHFIFNCPKDIVSGDFFWVAESGSKIYFAVADCTGHGVPGALMSILGVTVLNDSLQEAKCETPAEILNFLRERVKKEMGSKGKEISGEGMDIALCAFDRESNELEYAGANNPVFIVREGILETYTATRNPIGTFIREVPFENNKIKLKGGERIYLFSDGFADQFGGKAGGKFSLKRFKEFLIEINSLDMTVQKELVEDRLASWQDGWEQVDDILVLGLELPRFCETGRDVSVSKKNEILNVGEV